MLPLEFLCLRNEIQTLVFCHVILLKTKKKKKTCDIGMMAFYWKFILNTENEKIAAIINKL